MGRVRSTCVAVGRVVRGAVGCGVRFAGAVGAYLVVSACGSNLSIALEFVAANRFAVVFLDCYYLAFDKNLLAE